MHRELESRERLLLPWPDARRNSGERTLHRKSVGCVGLGFNWRHVCSYIDLPSRGLLSLGQPADKFTDLSAFRNIKHFAIVTGSPRILDNP